MTPDPLVTKSLRDRRRGLIGWTLGVVALVTIQMSVYPTIRDSRSGWESATESFPEVFREIFRITDYTSETGYLSTELLSFMVPLILMGLGASWGSRLTTEDEENGTADFVLGLPVSRGRFFFARVSASFLALLLTVSCFVIAMVVGGRIIGMSIAIDRFVAAGATVTALGLISLAIAALVGAVSGHRGVGLAVAMSIGVVAFVLYSLAPLVEAFDALNPINPWNWTIGRDPLNAGWGWWGLASSMALASVLLAASRWFFRRRDLVG